MNKSGPKFNLSKRCAPWMAGALLLATGAAHAELGGNFASVQADAQRLSGAVHTTSTANYDVHEIQVNSRAVERQYMDHTGRVFGIAWRSEGVTNLKAMLGSYFPKYQTGAVTRIDLHHSTLTTADLVVEVGSYVHTFMGRAYVPAKLPAGTAPSEIK